MKTVGELKAFIENLSDDMPLVSYQSDIEKSGYQNGLFCKVVSMQKETRGTYDYFDGCYYTYDVMVQYDDGILCLAIN